MLVDGMRWQHIGFTYNGTNWRGFLNGTRMFNLTKTFTLNTGVTSLYVATSLATWTACQLSDLRVYNAGIADNQVTASYMAGCWRQS